MDNTSSEVLGQVIWFISSRHWSTARMGLPLEELLSFQFPRIVEVNNGATFKCVLHSLQAWETVSLLAVSCAYITSQTQKGPQRWPHPATWVDKPRECSTKMKWPEFAQHQHKTPNFQIPSSVLPEPLLIPSIMSPLPCRPSILREVWAHRKAKPNPLVSWLRMLNPAS